MQQDHDILKEEERLQYFLVAICEDNKILSFKCFCNANKYYNPAEVVEVCSFSKWIRTGVPVLDAADPLLDDGLDGVGGELLLGHAAVVARVDPARNC